MNLFQLGIGYCSKALFFDCFFFIIISFEVGKNSPCPEEHGDVFSFIDLD